MLETRYWKAVFEIYAKESTLALGLASVNGVKAIPATRERHSRRDHRIESSD